MGLPAHGGGRPRLQSWEVHVDVSGVSAEDAELKAIRFVDSGCFIPNPDIDEVSYDGDTIVHEKVPEISKEKRNVIEK